MSSTMPPPPDHLLPCRPRGPRDTLAVLLLRLALVIVIGTAMAWCLVQGVPR
jgi:hypothetical protein